MQVMVGGTLDMFEFGTGDLLFRMAEPAEPGRFHFNEMQHRSFLGDDIDLVM